MWSVPAGRGPQRRVPFSAERATASIAVYGGHSQLAAASANSLKSTTRECAIADPATPHDGVVHAGKPQRRPEQQLGLAEQHELQEHGTNLENRSLHRSKDFLMVSLHAVLLLHLYAAQLLLFYHSPFSFLSWSLSSAQVNIEGVSGEGALPQKKAVIFRAVGNTFSVASSARSVCTVASQPVGAGHKLVSDLPFRVDAADGGAVAAPTSSGGAAVPERGLAGKDFQAACRPEISPAAAASDRFSLKRMHSGGGAGRGGVAAAASMSSMSISRSDSFSNGEAGASTRSPPKHDRSGSGGFAQDSSDGSVAGSIDSDDEDSGSSSEEDYSEVKGVEKIEEEFKSLTHVRPSPQ
jgi:hypothetical protein